MSVPVVTTYHAKAEHSEQVAALIASNWELLHKEGLATDHPAFVMRDADESSRFVEVFEWKSEDGPDEAWNHPAVADLWNEIQSLCTQDIEPRYYEMLSSTYVGGG